MLDNLYESNDCYGYADPEKKLICLQKTGYVTRKFKENGKEIVEQVLITEEDLIETYFHELVHIVLNVMGENRLYSNERFNGSRKNKKRCP